LVQSRILELLRNKKPQLLQERLRKIWRQDIDSIKTEVAKDGSRIMWDKVHTLMKRVCVGGRGEEQRPE
jgi:hypothetical protein